MRLACKQAVGSSPSSPQCAARPSRAEPSCDTDPTPITPRQPALIDPSNTLTSIYILFETCQVCCVYTFVCVFVRTTVAVHRVCVCVSLWMRHLLYCLLLTWIPLALTEVSGRAKLLNRSTHTHTHTHTRTHNTHAHTHQSKSIIQQVNSHSHCLEVCVCVCVSLCIRVCWICVCVCVCAGAQRFRLRHSE